MTPEEMVAVLRKAHAPVEVKGWPWFECWACSDDGINDPWPCDVAEVVATDLVKAEVAAAVEARTAEVRAAEAVNRQAFIDGMDGGQRHRWMAAGRSEFMLNLLRQEAFARAMRPRFHSFLIEAIDRAES